MIASQSLNAVIVCKRAVRAAFLTVKLKVGCGTGLLLKKRKLLAKAASGRPRGFRVLSRQNCKLQDINPSYRN